MTNLLDIMGVPFSLEGRHFPRKFWMGGHFGGGGKFPGVPEIFRQGLPTVLVAIPPTQVWQHLSPPPEFF